MARYRGKKSLYEVIRESQAKNAGQNKQINNKQDNQAKKQEKPEKKADWPRKPPLFYTLKGRVEFSLPYTGLAAVILGVLLLVLLAYRLGQQNAIVNSPEDGGTASVSGNTRNQGSTSANRAEQTRAAVAEPRGITSPSSAGSSSSASTSSAQSEETETRSRQVSSSGDNRIVIQTCPTRRPLEPAVDYFAENGISTEIIKRNGMYYLLTEAGFENPERKGTDGYRMKERIIELGADYKSPPGYASFGSKPFHDAYGMKFSN
jgi:hypothetical protein